MAPKKAPMIPKAPKMTPPKMMGGAPKGGMMPKKGGGGKHMH